MGLWFCQTGAYVYNTTVGTGTSVGLAYQGYGNYSAMFDQWRIREVRVSGYFSNNFSSTQAVTTNIPLFYTAVDYDGGSSAPTSVAGVLTYQNSVVHQACSSGQPAFVRTFVPRVIVALDNNLFTPANYGVQPEGSWIDTSTPYAPHYGMFFGYDNQGATLATSEGSLTLVYDISYEYRGVRA
jgi:hypothetical protein